MVTIIDLAQFTPWTLFTDFGFISMLLLVGKFIRIKVKLMQQLFIPPSLIAGLLGLAFGPNRLRWTSLSNDLGIYAAIFIASVFGTLPSSSPNIFMKEVTRRVGPIWVYVRVGMLLQWALAGLFGLYVVRLIWPDLNDASGIMLPTGFHNGHSTAAAIGFAFERLGWDEVRSLGTTTVTVGAICSTIRGLLMVKRAAKYKQTAFISDPDDFPDELRSGLLPKDKRGSIGETTTSSIFIDMLTSHVALVFVVAFLGYMVSQTAKIYYPVLELPVFSYAFIIGLISRKFFDATTISGYICPPTTRKLSSSFTDTLVTCGAASIKLGVIVECALPLIILITTGVAIVWCITFFLGGRLAKTFWFERMIFARGWWIGMMAVGIALLRIVDPKPPSKMMDDHAMTYLPIASIEILLIAFAPILFVNRLGVWLLLVCLVPSLLILLPAWKMG